jgi:hypothetical protein
MLEIRRCTTLEEQNKGDNITFNRGTSETYTLRRLKRDRPDLAEEVLNGELSANAALRNFAHRTAKPARTAKATAA